MSNKWGHPVAAFPVMNVTIHHIRSYPDPSTWETDVTLSTAGEQVQAMMREARNRAEGDQLKGTRKAIRTRKAVANVFTALEPLLGSKPIFYMQQKAFGPNGLEDCACAHL
eukprot:4061327-Pleurochrysis_carterae.AAC.1